MVNNMIIHGTEDTFLNEIRQGVVLVDFFATWCGPCKMLGPVLEEIASDQSPIKIVKMDVDEAPNIARQYGIMSVPTLILFKNGEELAKQTGFLPKDALQEWINEKIA